MLHPGGYRRLSSLAAISFEPGLAASDQASDWARYPMLVHSPVLALCTYLCDSVHTDLARLCCVLPETQQPKSMKHCMGCA